MENDTVLVSNEGNVNNSQKYNFIKRIAGILFYPTNVMKDLIDRPRILFPFLLNSFMLLIYYLCRYDLFREYIKKSLEASLSSQEVTPEQLGGILKFSEIGGLISAPVGSLFIWIATTLAIYIVVKLLGGKGQFKVYLSITGYAYTIILLNFILNFIASFFTGQLLLDTSIASITNLFFPNLWGSYLYGVIRGIDFFGLWYYTVIGIGIVHASNLKKSHAYCAVYIIFFITVLLGAGNYKYM